jgi:glycosidase
MNIWENGEKGSIILINRKISDDWKNAPALVTSGFNAGSFFVRCVKNDLENFVILWQNTVLDSSFYILSDSLIEITIPDNARQRKRSYIRMISSNKYGVSNDLFVPLNYGKIISKQSQLSRTDKQGMIMYFLMIDRFNNGSKANDMPVNDTMILPKVNYYGGDLQGVIDKIKSGFFDSLGVNTIWLSPVSQNPFDAWGLFPNPQTKFSGYHGYWPLYNTQIDVRFGNSDIFKKLIDDAHGRGINVILDYVANHVHISSPTYQQHPDWVTPDTTPDGRPNFELWDEFRLTTWFDRHIPTLDLERPEVTDAMTDTALYWIDNYALDGYRHDATKHIPEIYWRTLIRKMKQRYPDRNVYQIGETYGSPELINSYVKTGMLDGQFDFNLYDAIIWTLADNWSGSASMEWIATILGKSLRTYGYHNLMGIISGNQDRPRFISLAGGSLKPDEDSKVAGWMREIGVGDSIYSYSRLKMLQAFMLTLPGIPCIYYGDEYGMPGANDTDNRRMMKFDEYSPMQRDVLNNMRSLIALRKNNMSLIYGDLVPLFIDKDVIVYERVYMGEYVITAFNKGTEEREFSVTEALSGKEITVKIPAGSYDIIKN